MQQNRDSYTAIPNMRTYAHITPASLLTPALLLLGNAESASELTEVLHWPHCIGPTAWALGRGLPPA